MPEAKEADVDAAVAAARLAFDEGPWPRMSPKQRADALRRVRDELQRRLPELEAVWSAELGAPAAVSGILHRFALEIWDQALTFHETLTFREERSWSGGTGVVIHEPIGVVAAVIPWNAP